MLLDIGAPLIATVTRRALNELDLKVGQDVFAIVDPTAIDRRSILTADAAPADDPDTPASRPISTLSPHRTMRNEPEEFGHAVNDR